MCVCVRARERDFHNVDVGAGCFGAVLPFVDSGLQRVLNNTHRFDVFSRWTSLGSFHAPKEQDRKTHECAFVLYACTGFSFREEKFCSYFGAGWGVVARVRSVVVAAHTLVLASSLFNTTRFRSVHSNCRRRRRRSTGHGRRCLLPTSTFSSCSPPVLSAI